MPKFLLKNLEKGPKKLKRNLENLEILVEKLEYTLKYLLCPTRGAKKHREKRAKLSLPKICYCGKNEQFWPEYSPLPDFLFRLRIFQFICYVSIFQNFYFLCPSSQLSPRQVAEPPLNTSTTISYLLSLHLTTEVETSATSTLL